jgi:hypothetical protein
MSTTALPNRWVIVSSPENFATTAELGFTLQGIKSRHRKKAEQIRPGDTVIYYITGKQALAAIAQVTSSYFEDQTRVWNCKSNRDTEVYPFRFRLAPDLILPESAYLPAQDLAGQLTYLKKWPAEHWRLGFQGNIHLWPEADYQLAREAMLAQQAKAVVV